MVLPAWDQENEAAQSDSRLDRVARRPAQEPKRARLIHRPARDIIRRGGSRNPPLACQAGDAQVAGQACLVQRKSVPSLHIRCMMTASLRASATIALRWPRRLATFMAQAFSQDHFDTRVSSTCAAS